jgi:hypothetical protein
MTKYNGFPNGSLAARLALRGESVVQSMEARRDVLWDVMFDRGQKQVEGERVDRSYNRLLNAAYLTVARDLASVQGDVPKAIYLEELRVGLSKERG